LRGQVAVTTSQPDSRSMTPALQRTPAWSRAPRSGSRVRSPSSAPTTTPRPATAAFTGRPTNRSRIARATAC
jgi:hypothetical protein